MAVARLALLLDHMHEGKCSCVTFEAVAAVLPGDAVEDDGCELMACCRKISVGDAAQNRTGGQGQGSVDLFVGLQKMGHKKSARRWTYGLASFLFLGFGFRSD